MKFFHALFQFPCLLVHTIVKKNVVGIHKDFVKMAFLGGFRAYLAHDPNLNNFRAGTGLLCWPRNVVNEP